MSEVIVLDTHVAVWVLSEPELLSRKAREAIEKERIAGSRLSIADVSLWEIAMMVRKGIFGVGVPVESILKEVESTYHVEPVTGSIAAKAMSFGDHYPKDPMDRLIGATAVIHGAMLVTKDDRIRKSGEVECIW